MLMELCIFTKSSLELNPIFFKSYPCQKSQDPESFMGRFPTQTFSCESSQNVAKNGKGVVMNSHQKRVSRPSDAETRLVDGCEQTCGSGNQIRALQPLTLLLDSEFHNL